MMFETKYENQYLYIFIHNNGEVTFQDAPYIEDGWYIKLNDGYYEVWEIVQYGDGENMQGKFFEFSDAYKFARNLS